MKLDMNFQAEERRRARQFRLVLIVLTGTAGTALIAVLMATLLAATHDPHTGTMTVESEGDALSVVRMVQIADQSDRLAREINHRGVAVHVVLNAVQQSLPVNVKLRSLDYSAEHGRGLLVAESADPAQLNVFVRDLDEKPGIGSVMVARQTTDPQQADRHVHEVVLMAEAL